MKILLIEDDDRIAEALAEAFGDRNYNVDVARDRKFDHQLATLELWMNY
ncbi:MAG TPA: response regulator transcription factor [Oscillatoriales cyanobacterium M59_W2019_021]|nr:response regulator transcription factor [Oscillatoriales cyanobacterium M4454_W2019_049]HIK51071.1 response regulator transcription factor [Oscillatoriales cyanobacterium M59_W2019_021]